MKILIEILNQIENESLKTSSNSQIPSLKEEIKEAQIGKILVPKLATIEKEIKELFLRIKKCNTLQQANYFFDLLQKIQEILAQLFYKQKITLSENLQKFVSDFDRIDDPWLREYMLNAIKNNEYFL